MITDRTRAIVPTHLYGLPCDMDRLLEIAARHNLVVHRGLRPRARRDVRGRPVGTFGTAALFSFQTLKPLNCYGGGIALVHDAALAAKVRAHRRRAAVAEREACRAIACCAAGCSASSSSRGCSRFRCSPSCGCRRSSTPIRTCFSGRRSGRSIRCPTQYTERFPNVQAAIGLAALAALDGWTAQAQANARYMNAVLGAPAGHAGAAGAARPDARLLSILRLRPQGRSATTSWCAACAAASTSRRCTWTCRRTCRSSRAHAPSAKARGARLRRSDSDLRGLTDEQLAARRDDGPGRASRLEQLP